MSSVSGTITSSPFAVKDDALFESDIYIKAYKELCESNGGFFEKDKGKWSFAYGGEYPSTLCYLPDFDSLSVDDREEGEFNVCSMLTDYLVEGEVCMITSAGHEKNRYVDIFINVVTNKGFTSIDFGNSYKDVVTPAFVNTLMKSFLVRLENIGVVMETLKKD